MNRPPRRTAAKLSQSTHRRLSSYALAASAAGVGMLALAPPSEAEIVYTPPDRIVVISKGHSYNLDLNHDGITDFTLQVRTFSGTSTFSSVLSARPAAGNGARGFETAQGAPWASALKAGAVIGRYQYFPGKLMAEIVDTAGGSVISAGSWLNVKNRYLGLSFQINGKTHYGWARLSVEKVQGALTAVLSGYAYETIANKSILAGKTKDTEKNGAADGAGLNGITPDAVTLGALAGGAPGLSTWRREQLTRDPQAQ